MSKTQDPKVWNAYIEYIMQDKQFFYRTVFQRVISRGLAILQGHQK